MLFRSKVWTTLAHHSNYGVLIARTDPEVVKHAGISMFIVDMRDPAIEIRAIHQIDGGMHFNEIFFTDLAIPADWILGEYNAGWKQATAMLMYERVAIGTGTKSGITTPMFNRIKREATKLGVAMMPGCHTPTEMLDAYHAGAPLQKLFPGPGLGPAWVRATLGPLPFLRIVPTSGVDETNASEYLDAGASKFVLFPFGEPGDWTAELERLAEAELPLQT